MSVVARPEPADRPAGGTEALTDLGNAERFVAAHGHRFRYVHEWGRWLEWRDGRWRDDTTGEATRAAKTTARALLAEAAALGDSDARSRLAKWGATSQAEPRIRALLTLACTEPEVAISAAQLDQHPFALACANGTIDLRTGKLRAPDPADLITRGTDVVYEPDADCSRWRRLLAEVFAGDVELIGFVQRFVGYWPDRRHTRAGAAGVPRRRREREDDARRDARPAARRPGRHRTVRHVPARP